MILKSFFVFAAIASPFGTASNNSSTARRCKTLPDSPDWPSIDRWTALNDSVNGRLQPAVATGAVCHSTEPIFNQTACNIITHQWTNSSFHASNPWSVDYNDDTCTPDAALPCSSKGYPAYAVEAVNITDVQQAVNFARDTGVRLVIKGTGHDYIGRSTGPGTLELWTHRLQGVAFNPGDPRGVSLGTSGTAKIASGMRWGEVYHEAARHNLTVIGGADPNVGVGGFILHGGHGPLSSLYGLGADQILEMEVVTADGEYRIINETSHADLFWALRGGGASTFAVLLSVTVKAYPTLPGTIYSATFNTTADSDTFWSLAAHLSAKMPALSEAGGMGYYYMYPFNGNNDSAQAGGIFATFVFPQKTPEQAVGIMTPFASSLTNSSWAKDKVFTAHQITEFSSFMQYWSMTNPAGKVGVNSRLGSWLAGTGLNGNIEILKSSLRAATDPKNGLIGHVVAGKGVRDAKIPGGSNAVLPAWRKAYVHFVSTAHWDSLNLTQKAVATVNVRDTIQPALRSIEPDSGSYVNEADPTNLQWQRDYFGATYPRLLDIKKQWDPEGVFYCRPCVGHELWEIVDGPADQPKIEWGVGQTGGQFCRKNQ